MSTYMCSCKIIGIVSDQKYDHHCNSYEMGALELPIERIEWYSSANFLSAIGKTNTGLVHKVKDTKFLIVMLGGVSLLGLMVMLCGIGLSFGFRTLSLFGFIGAIALLIILRIIGRANCSEKGRRQ